MYNMPTIADQSKIRRAALVGGQRCLGRIQAWTSLSRMDGMISGESSRGCLSGDVTGKVIAVLLELIDSIPTVVLLVNFVDCIIII